MVGGLGWPNTGGIREDSDGRRRPNIVVGRYSRLGTKWMQLIRRANRHTMTTNTGESFSLMATGRFASEIVWQPLSFSNKDVNPIVFYALLPDKAVYFARRLHYLTILWLIIVLERARWVNLQELNSFGSRRSGAKPMKASNFQSHRVKQTTTKSHLNFSSRH